MMGSYDICQNPTNFYLLASGFRYFFAVIATHLLAGEVDTTLDEADLLSKISWLLRYFNPVNLSWRYYSMLAYRFSAKQWGEKQLALMNFEAHPNKPPVPYVLSETIIDYRVRRLEIARLFSSQGLLSISSAYQGILAVQYTISSAGIAFLPNITMPLAIMGFFRTMVSPWIASKVYVDPYPYPSEVADPSDWKVNKIVVCAWFAVLTSLVMLSFWPYKAYPAFRLPSDLLDLSIQLFYQYVTLSEFLFHIALLRGGANALGNRIAYFDNWIYKLQTLGFVLFLTETLIVGVADFVRHNYYRQCA